MRAKLAITSLLALSLIPAATSAQDTTPDLLGRWSVDAEAMIVDRVESGPPRSVVLALEFDITWQEGTRFSGQEAEHRSDSEGSQPTAVDEYFAGVVGAGNLSVHMVDENGLRDCWIMTMSSMSCVYRHIEDHRSVVSTEIWHRLVN